MKNLLFALLIFTVTMITACSDNPSGDDDTDTFEPYQIGTWYVAAPDSAEWTGSLEKGKTFHKAEDDTIYIDAPDSHRLSVWKDTTNTNSGNFQLTLVDSTLNRYSFGESSVTRDLHWEDKAETPFGQGGHSGSATDEYMQTNFSLTYQCPPTYNSLEYIHFIFRNDEAAIVRIYRIEVIGIIDAVHEVAC